MKYLPLFLLLFTCSKVDDTRLHLINDNVITNQEYTLNELIEFGAEFPKNKLTKNEIKIVYKHSKKQKIHPIFVFSLMQKESGIFVNPTSDTNRYEKLLNLCMGYALNKKKWIDGKKYYKYYGFKIQVSNAVRCLSEHFNSWDKNCIIKPINTNTIITPMNAATYMILKYTPFIGIHQTYGRHNSGVETLIIIHNKLYNIWLNKKAKEKIK